MRTENVVLNNTEMQIINIAVSNYLNVVKQGRVLKKDVDPIEVKALKHLNEEIENQLVKSFGEFEFNLRDSASITLLVHYLWNAYKITIENNNNNQVSYSIKKNIMDIFNTFTGVYMDLCPSLKEGTEFRKVFDAF